MLKQALLILILALASILQAQEKVSTVGFQLKPIFSSSLFGTGPETVSDSGFTYTFKQPTGFAGGMIIRKGYTKNLSLEFGLNFTRRNVYITSSHAGVERQARMRIIGYELPVSQLVFVRLSKTLYMNVSAGLCINMFPSDVQTLNDVVYVIGGRRLVFNPSLISNIGFEHRTAKSGYFYLGASLNRPFVPIYTVLTDYFQNNDVINTVSTNLRGTYLTLDFRYFFHEDPEKRKARTNKAKSPVAKPPGKNK